MIVKFTTQTGALTMHGDGAVTLLRAMGHSGTVPGAILAADLPAGLARLRKMLETQSDMPSPASAEAGPADDEERENAPPPVTLRMRAVPLIEMIENAIARGSDLMWERG